MILKYTSLELFMENLKLLISTNHNPVINNHPLVLSKMPQLKLLYEELGSMIQTLLLIDEHQHVTYLQKRFKDAAEDAHDIVDLFVYHINLRNIVSPNQISVSNPRRIKVLMVCVTNVVCGVLWGPSVYQSCQQSWLRWNLSSYRKIKRISLNLDDVMGSIKSIKEELLKIRDNTKMDSSPRTDSCLKTTSAAAGPACARGTKKVSEDIVVGFDRHAEVIRDKLAEDQKQLDVVSIVGMGGLGKTTLATKVFNDPFVKYHFHVRGWVTVSQTYEKEDLLIQILESIGIERDNVRNQDCSQLREKLHKTLMGDRYLIVIDDIWSTKAWDVLKLFFPNNHTQSRILITSRYKEVALHAKSHGFIHYLEFLTEEESWELLCKKTFHGTNACPEWLIEPGMKISRNCHGLPLALVVVAGVLTKEALNKDSWERIGSSVSSYIVSNETGSVETLAWSFDHLPGHLRDCYLYLGGFPEDHKFRVQRLIWLWIAEGFIKEDGIRSLEEIAEDHVTELVDRNLVVVADWKSHGGIKTVYVHDLLMELCFKIATKENMYLKAKHTTHSIETYMQRRIFIEDNINIKNAPRIRSLLCFYRLDDRREVISKWSHFWMLLMVLDLQIWPPDCFPEEISRLVHLRYLAISYNEDVKFPSSICNLWSLQTLIIRGFSIFFLKMPKDISNLVNLRHLKCEGYSGIEFPAIQKPMNLQTISRVRLRKEAESWVKCFPGIKKLSCDIQRHTECDLESLTSLEKLQLSGHLEELNLLGIIRLPVSLKKLTLGYCELPWSHMSIIQSLPNLEVLKLLTNAFVGRRWDVGKEQFRRLKFLKLSQLEIKEWEASDVNFPCLKQLVVEWCNELEEIPSDFGYIPTLELISVYICKDSVVESLEAILEEQRDQGNFDLKISIKREKGISDVLNILRES